MVSQTVTLSNSHGLHIGPATTFANGLSQFPCTVEVIAQGKRIDAKSALGLMGVGITKGMEIEIVCTGDREDEALAHALHLIESFN